MASSPTVHLRQRGPRPLFAAALAGAAVLLGLGGAPARADSPVRPSSPAPAAFAQECASCHMAYPPGLLPAASWQRLMGDLQRHYGSDASVDAATRDALTRWLVANAGTYKRAREEPPQDRISRAAWFQRKHREVDAATFVRPSIESPSNCMACHPRADQGDFNEHAVRIPR